MGEVHLAVARGAAGFEKLVAIKFLDEQSVKDRELARGLLREAFLGVQLDHEHIVSVLDLGEEARRYFIVMEYVRGFTLGHVLSHLDAMGEGMPVGVALHVARATLDAIEYLHRARDTAGRPLGLVHGDISPSNVLLAGDGRIKLSDFGVATFAIEHGERSTIAGKLSYLPPEAFAHAPRGPAWDVYAAAALLYEAIAGVPAFPAASLDAVRNALRRGVPPLAGHRPDVPEALAELIERALAFHPDRRPAGLTELRAELDAVAPRQLDDEEQHRALVARVYGDPRFVEQHGELPTTAGYSLDNEARVADAVIKTTDVAAQTQGRVRPRALRFGVSPAMGAARARNTGERFTSFLSAKIGREVRPVVLADYAMLVACLVQGEIDLAWMPPTSFVAAVEHGAGVLAQIRRAGQTSYQAAIIVRTGEVATLEELRGKSMAWVDQDSASGYLLPLAELRRVLGDPATELGEQTFVGSHQAVCEAVLKGWADAGATYASRDATGVVSAGWRDHLGDRAKRVEPLWFSPPIPGDSIASRPFLPEALRATLVSALIGLADSEIGRTMLVDVFNAETMVAAEVSDYDGVRDALAAVTA
jgi:phosphate/phosphite/phosphonate ABC transporter binding protein